MKCLVSVISIVLSGCSTIDIKDAVKTSDNRFDGQWFGDLNSLSSTQVSDAGGNEFVKVFDCEEISANVTAEVVDGRINGLIPLETAVEFSSNISNEGKFYAEIPRESVYLVEGRSRFAAREYHVISGVLSAASGTGEAQYQSAFGMPQEGGCSYPLTLTQRKGS